MTSFSLIPSLTERSPAEPPPSHSKWMQVESAPPIWKTTGAEGYRVGHILPSAPVESSLCEYHKLILDGVSYDTECIVILYDMLSLQSLNLLPPLVGRPEP